MSPGTMKPSLAAGQAVRQDADHSASYVPFFPRCVERSNADVSAPEAPGPYPVIVGGILPGAEGMLAELLSFQLFEYSLPAAQPVARERRGPKWN